MDRLCLARRGLLWSYTGQSTSTFDGRKVALQWCKNKEQRNATHPPSIQFCPNRYFSRAVWAIPPELEYYFHSYYTWSYIAQNSNSNVPWKPYEEPVSLARRLSVRRARWRNWWMDRLRKHVGDRLERWSVRRLHVEWYGGRKIGQGRSGIRGFCLGFRLEGVETGRWTSL